MLVVSFRSALDNLTNLNAKHQSCLKAHYNLWCAHTITTNAGLGHINKKTKLHVPPHTYEYAQQAYMRDLPDKIRDQPTWQQKITFKLRPLLWPQAEK